MANQISSVGFQSPAFDYTAEQSEIARRQKMADMLQAQSMQPLETQTAGGWAIPISPFQGLAKIGQGIAGGYAASRAQEGQRELATRAQKEMADVLRRGGQALSGTPASEMPGTELAPAFTTPAVAPDMNKAAEIYMSHPMTSGLGMDIIQKDLQRKQWAGLFGQQATAQQGNPMVAGGDASVMAGSGPQQAQGIPNQPGGILAGTGITQGDAQASLLSDPTGKQLMEKVLAARAEAMKPVINRGFGIGTMQGGKYVADPASLSQAMDMEREKARIGAGFGVHNVTNASGATVPTFGYQLSGFGGLPGASQQPHGASQPAGAPSQAAPRGTPVAPSGGSGDPWATIPKRPVPQGMGQTTFDKSMAEHQAGTATELSKKYGEAADHANQRMVLNNQALSLVDKADTGPGAAQAADVKNILTSRFGIAEDRFQNTPSATIALQKDLLNAATQKAKAQFGARMTQSEVLLMLSKGAPNVDMTKAAIKYLINSDNAAAQYQIKQANDLGTYLGKGGDPLRFEGWYSNAFPMTKAVGAVHMGRQNAVKDIVQSGGGSPDDPLGLRGR